MVWVTCEPSVDDVAFFENQDQVTRFQLRHPEQPGTTTAFAMTGTLREGMMKQIVLGAPGYRQRFTLEIEPISKGVVFYKIARCLAVGWMVTEDLEAKWQEMQKKAQEEKNG